MDWIAQLACWVRRTNEFRTATATPAGAPPRRPDSRISASLTRARRTCGEVLQELIDGYEASYAQFLTPGGPAGATAPDRTNISETVPVAYLGGTGRTKAEADAELARILAVLEGISQGGGGDGGWDHVGTVREVLDPARRALPSSVLWGATTPPVAHGHMLWARPNGQGTLVHPPRFPLDRCPEIGNNRQVYHTLQPLPFFPPAHAGFGRKYYR